MRRGVGVATSAGVALRIGDHHRARGAVPVAWLGALPPPASRCADRTALRPPRSCGPGLRPPLAPAGAFAISKRSGPHSGLLETGVKDRVGTLPTPGRPRRQQTVRDGSESVLCEDRVSKRIRRAATARRGIPAARCSSRGGCARRFPPCPHGGRCAGPRGCRRRPASGGSRWRAGPRLATIARRN